MEARGSRSCPVPPPEPVEAAGPGVRAGGGERPGPPGSTRRTPGWSAAARRAAARFPRVQAEDAAEPTQLSPSLVAYVGVVAAGAAAAATLTVRAGADPLLLVLGGCATAGLALTAVRALSGVSSHWSASIFAHLGLSLAAGPAGALVAAAGELAGSQIRLRSGWLKGTFNLSNDFVSSLAAWAVFHGVTGGGLSLGRGLAAGLAAGATQYAINVALLTGVQRIAAPGFATLAYVRNNVANVLPYHLGAGCTAFGGVVLVASVGPGGFVLLLVPVALLQAFLVVLAVRTRQAAEQRRAHLHERELLLRQALDASEAERRRIARDLHDGVVQDLAAIALGLRTHAERAAGGEEAATLLRAADATADAMGELRTLMREIAPPDLQETGLAVAVEAAAQPLRDQGVEVLVEIDEAARAVRGDALTTAFRIAQEALRNATQHARAARVTVGAHLDPSALQIVVTDDGAGFSGEERRSRMEAGHVGLSLLQDLARDAGGVLSVESAPRRGTTVRARIPVRPS